MNIYAELLKVLPSEPLQVGTVTTLHGDGTTTLTLPGGAQIRLRGQLGLTVAGKAFYKGGETRGAAPNLTTVTIEV